MKRVFLGEDGTVRENGPDGRPLQGRTDWERLDAMTDEDVRRAAAGDPDALPLTAQELAGARRVPDRIDVRAIRQRLHLTQEAFAERYGFSLPLLRDWELGRLPPSRWVRVLLKVIDREPEAVERALAS